MFINEDINKIKNIFIKIFNNKINFDKFTKNKLINLCQTFNPQNNNYILYLKDNSTFEHKNQESKKAYLNDENNLGSEIKNNKIFELRKKSFNIFKKPINIFLGHIRQ